MWSLRWSEKPEERDRNPSSPQKYVAQTRCRSGLQNLDGWVRFLGGVLKLIKKMKTKMKYKR